MSVQEIQSAIVELPPGELADLVEWIEGYRFDALRQRVREQREARLCRPL